MQPILEALAERHGETAHYAVLEGRSVVYRAKVDRLREDAAVEAWARGGDLRARGHGTDDQENEIGINCLARPVFLGSPTVPSGAISISALTYRTALTALVEDIPALRAIIEDRAA